MQFVVGGVDVSGSIQVLLVAQGAITKGTTAIENEMAIERESKWKEGCRSG